MSSTRNFTLKPIQIGVRCSGPSNGPRGSKSTTLPRVFFSHPIFRNASWNTFGIASGNIECLFEILFFETSPAIHTSPQSVLLVWLYSCPNQDIGGFRITRGGAEFAQSCFWVHPVVDVCSHSLSRKAFGFPRHSSVRCQAFVWLSTQCVTA